MLLIYLIFFLNQGGFFCIFKLIIKLLLTGEFINNKEDNLLLVGFNFHPAQQELKAVLI